MGCSNTKEVIDLEEDEEVKIMAGRIKATIGAGPYVLLGPKRPKTPEVKPRKSKRVQKADTVDDLLASSPELDSEDDESEEKLSNKSDEDEPSKAKAEEIPSKNKGGNFQINGRNVDNGLGSLTKANVRSYRRPLIADNTDDETGQKKLEEIDKGGNFNINGRNVSNGLGSLTKANARSYRRPLITDKTYLVADDETGQKKSMEIDKEIIKEAINNKLEDRHISRSDTYSDITLADLQSLTASELAAEEPEIPFEAPDPNFRPFKESAPRMKYNEGNYYSVAMSPIESCEDLDEAARISELNEEIMEMVKFDVKSKSNGSRRGSTATSGKQSKFGSRLSLSKKVKASRISTGPFGRNSPDTNVPDDYDAPSDGRINKQLGY